MEAEMDRKRVQEKERERGRGRGLRLFVVIKRVPVTAATDPFPWLLCFLTVKGADTQ